MGDGGDGNSLELIARHCADRLSERCVAVLVNRFAQFPTHDQVPGRCVVGFQCPFGRLGRIPGI